jgi:N-acylglucosamine-6-phosphate 2-epimerase
LDGFRSLDLVRKRIGVPIVADVSTFDEGVRASELGADVIATTLSGYTAYTEDLADNYPDFNLIERLTAEIKTPILA